MTYFEVAVPIHSTQRPELLGVHVFTGQAPSRSAAVQAAYEGYDMARAAMEAGLEISCGRPNGWGACGYRTGWELDWTAATASLWRSPYGWPAPGSHEL
ncbi:hypothetical protein [Streptomyces erythrochromogenes]|uniref:hypothetical protein n=1 Tax=Streptomyces erythrochromogenes TaxID=285574 RepID=UPI00381F1FF7